MRPYAALALLFLALPARALHDPATPGGIAPPELTRYVAPEYPREAREGGFEGEVVLELEIDATGALHDVRIVEDPGHGLGEAAAAAARRFQFSPAHGPDGEPIAAIIRFSHRFDLHGDESGDAPKSGPHPPPAEAPLPEGSYAETVKGERPFTAASSTEIRDRDFLLRPRTTPSDILRVVPGLVTAQHAGGGKADQLFLRGFDADHGTDVAIFVDGVPVNLPTHGHGQGYADLHWLIPEAVESVEVRKGPYHADLGDFDTAGAVLLKTKERFASSSVSVLGGQLGTFRVLGIAAPDLGASRPFFAAEVYGTDGPFEYPQGLRRYNVFAKETWALSPRDQVTALATGYAAQWRASGQIPERAVGVPGGIDRFGAIDPTEGGNTERQMLTVGYSHREASSDFSLSAYAVRTRLSLFSDFTFQARDPVHGDQIDQTDDRVYAGFNARYRKTFTLLDRPGAVTLGAGDRMDGVDNELVHVEKRQRLDGCFPDPVTGIVAPNPCLSTRTRQSNLSAWAQGEWEPLSFLRLVAGLRGDLFEWDVTDLRTAAQRAGGADLSGIAQKHLLSPKGTAVVTLPIETAPTQLFANFGLGFHSNDARAAVASNGSGALPRAVGEELGARTRLPGKVDLAAALWALHLQSEQVWSGDTGGTEASDPTDRYGIDLEARWEILDWLFADLDVSLSHAEYTQDRGNGSAVALAPTRTIMGGLTARHPLGIEAALRLRHIGDRAANQEATITAPGYTIVDLHLAYKTKRFEVGVIVENLADAEWREAQFDDTSRLAGPPYNETKPVEGIHFTPGNPRNGRVFATIFF